MRAGIPANDIDGIAGFAVKEGIDYAVVAPDDPLVLGAGGQILTNAEYKCFGPDGKCGDH